MPDDASEGLKVLIAEDDPVSGQVLSTVLKKLGYRVIFAEDGRDAWYSFVAERPRIVVTDWMMPHMDGLELCRRIRAEGRTQYTYVILLTALAGKDNFLEAMKSGADDFISKPFEREALRVRLKVAERTLSLQREVSQLKGLLPICSYCKKIRDVRNQWHVFETYVAARTDTSFTNSLCPECAAAEAGSAVTDQRRE